MKRGSVCVCLCVLYMGQDILSPDKVVQVAIMITVLTTLHSVQVLRI